MKDKTGPTNLGEVFSVRGNAVEDTGGPLKAPVGKGILARMAETYKRRTNDEY